MITFTAPKIESFGKHIKLKLTVRDHGGLKGAADGFIFVMQNEFLNEPPAVYFSHVTSRKTVTFIDRSTDSDGSIVLWFWDFGDGKTSTQQNPRHRYAKYKNYTVTLTVTDDRGASRSSSKNIAVKK